MAVVVESWETLTKVLIREHPLEEATFEPEAE